MSSTGASTDTSTEVPEVGTIDMKLEVVTLPVSDVDRAKSFYQSLGRRLASEPGSADRLILAVKDIDSAPDDLISRGVDVSDVYERRPPGFESQEERSYFTYASFSDPDGNAWLLQEIETRLPGREWED
jgi:catechol 2,3-dioxygenase-like lactoylglutathione lyase family enzyme